MQRTAVVGPGLLLLIASSDTQPFAADDGTLCTSEKTPADQALAACGRLINSRLFSGANLASSYFGAAVHEQEG